MKRFNRKQKNRLFTVGLAAGVLLAGMPAYAGEPEIPETTDFSTVQEMIAVQENLQSNVVTDDSLVIVLDPGHGGTNSGTDIAVSKYGDAYLEKYLTLKVAQAAKKELEKYENVSVYLTRNDNDTTLNNEARIAYAQSVSADSVISLHFNSLSDMSQAEVVSGAEIWESVIEKYKATGLAEQILHQLGKLGLVTTRGVKARPDSGDNTYYWDEVNNCRTKEKTEQLADYYGILMYGCTYRIPALIVEHAFLSNSGDVALLQQEDSLNMLGQADAVAIAKYYGLKLKTLLQGDVDKNGSVDLNDARKVLRAALGIEPLSEEAMNAADIDHSENINLTDAYLTLRLALGID